MKKSKFLLLSVLALCLALLLPACASDRRGQSSPYLIYHVVKSTDTQFWLSDFAGANAAKAEYGVELVIVGPDTEEEYERQNELIAQAVAEGADAIVFSAISYTGNAEAIDAAADAGVKIVVIDGDVDSDKVDVRIGTDNLQAGRMTGTAVLDTQDTEIHVGIVNFDKESRNGQEREAGLREVLAEDPRVQSITTINVNANAEDARFGTELLLNEHPEINVVVGLNEPLAVGVGMAVDTRGQAGEVRVVGFDTNVQCVEMMRDGVISALIAQNPYAMGYLGVEYAWKLLEGGTFDGSKWVDTATTLITPENMFTPESQRMLFAFG